MALSVHSWHSIRLSAYGCGAAPPREKPISETRDNSQESETRNRKLGLESETSQESETPETRNRKLTQESETS